MQRLMIRHKGSIIKRLQDSNPKLDKHRQEKNMGDIRRKFIVLFALLFLASCAGGMSFSRQHQEFPEEQIRQLAGQIEEVVQFSSAEPESSKFNVDQTTGEVTGEFQPLDLLIGVDEIRQKVPALAELGADTEPMLSAIRGRVLRRPSVYELQQKGCVGENREGFIGNIKGKSCGADRHEKDRVAYIILLENRDRRAIHEQLIEALGLPDSDIGRIRKIFGEQAYMKAWAGTPLQTSGGDWEKR